MEGFQSQQWLFSELRGFLLVHLFFATSLTGKISNLDPECGSALAASVSFYLPHEYHLKLNMMPYSSVTYLYIRYLLLDINTLMCNVVLITVEFWMEVVASNRFVLYACGRKKNTCYVCKRSDVKWIFCSCRKVDPCPSWLLPRCIEVCCIFWTVLEKIISLSFTFNEEVNLKAFIELGFPF